MLRLIGRRSGVGLARQQLRSLSVGIEIRPLSAHTALPPLPHGLTPPSIAPWVGGTLCSVSQGCNVQALQSAHPQNQKSWDVRPPPVLKPYNLAPLHNRSMAPHQAQ